MQITQAVRGESANPQGDMKIISMVCRLLPVMPGTIVQKAGMGIAKTMGRCVLVKEVKNKSMNLGTDRFFEDIFLPCDDLHDHPLHVHQHDLHQHYAG